MNRVAHLPVNLWSFEPSSGVKRVKFGLGEGEINCCEWRESSLETVAVLFKYVRYSLKVIREDSKKYLSSGNVAVRPRLKWYFKFYCAIGGNSSCLCVRKLLFLRIQNQRLLCAVNECRGGCWSLPSGLPLYRWVILRRNSELIFSQWDRK